MSNLRKLIRQLLKINSKRILQSGVPQRKSTKLSGNNRLSPISVRVWTTSSSSSKIGKKDYSQLENRWKSCERLHLMCTNDSLLICLKEEAARTMSFTAPMTPSRLKTSKCIPKT